MVFIMSSSNTKLQHILPSAPFASSPSETCRAKSIATRLTEAEFVEVESAASAAGKKVSEWLRDAALKHSRVKEELTNSLLLAEIIGMRSLMLNLFAKASEGPISVEDLRKMSAYADSMKEQKLRDALAQRRRQSITK